MMGKVLVAAMLVAISTSAFAQAGNPGTPEEQAACRPDTRRFCIHVKPEQGPFAFLACLQANRAKLSKACRGVLESNGQ